MGGTAILASQVGVSSGTFVSSGFVLFLVGIIIGIIIHGKWVK
jgi:hypothetical protein